MDIPFVHYIYGTAEKFKTCDKDPNAIYFITDTQTGAHRIYMGETCFNVDIVSDLDNITSSDVVPSAISVKAALNKKSDVCTVNSFDSTTVPECITMENDHEYRYTSLTDCTGVTIEISAHREQRFYSSLILHTVNSTTTLEEFVTIQNNSGFPVRLLNGDTSLAGMDTVELLFFDNGLSTCCIGAAYKYEL